MDCVAAVDVDGEPEAGICAAHAIIRHAITGAPNPTTKFIESRLVGAVAGVLQKRNVGRRQRRPLHHMRIDHGAMLIVYLALHFNH